MLLLHVPRLGRKVGEPILAAALDKGRMRVPRATGSPKLTARTDAPWLLTPDSCPLTSGSSRVGKERLSIPDLHMLGAIKGVTLAARGAGS